MKLLVFGPGYSATAAIDRLRVRADWVAATARSPERAAELQAKGIRPLVFDGSAVSADLAAVVADTTHILVSIPPGENGDPVIASAGDMIASAPHVRSIVYLSTVGVYGDHGGEWVDETTPPRPKSRRSIARLAAEDAWRALASAAEEPLALLRLAGIYGPGRNALRNLADGTARRIIKPGQMFNRIHVADIAAAIDAAFAQEAEGICNVTDDEPAPPQDVVAFAAGLLGIAPPPEEPFETVELTPIARSFYGENKKVRNRRLKETLGVTLAYPTFREGLRALWASGEGR